MFTRADCCCLAVWLYGSFVALSKRGHVFQTRAPASCAMDTDYKMSDLPPKRVRDSHRATSNTIIIFLLKYVVVVVQPCELRGTAVA